MMDTIHYLDFDCVEIRSGRLSALVTQSVGPRLISLRLDDGPNLFAELPELVVDCPGHGPFHFYGGHRLWRSPEVLEETYLPDNQPVAIEAIPQGLTITQATEASTGLQKSLRVEFSGEENGAAGRPSAGHLPDASLTVDHFFTNHGETPIECALWAITQFRPGGVAILPQATELVDPGGLQPNRSLILWPYTQMRSAHIHWGDRYILVESTPHTQPLKLGFPNPCGWLAYQIEDTLFVKSAAYQPGAFYYDRGSSSQCYCRWDFLELETLSPRLRIPPGETATHRELWRIYSSVSFPPSEEAASQLIIELGFG